MELGAILSFFFIELLAGVLVFFYWSRRHSELDLAKAQFAEAVVIHRENGTIHEYVERIASGKLSVFRKRKKLVLYLKTFLSMIIGIAVIYCIKRYTGAGVVLRTILGILFILPFMTFLAIAIAEEADENRIADFERAAAKELAESIKQEDIEPHMAAKTMEITA